MKKGKKILAAFLAVLMVVGIMPITSFSGLFANKVQAKTVTGKIDVSGGLKTGQIYGDENVVKVEVLEDMKLKNTETTIDGVKYAGYVQGTTNPSPKAGNIPTAGAAVKITAVADSTITFVVNKTNKVYHFVESETKADQNSQKDTDGKATGTLAENTYKFNMEGGKTYYFYLDGSKIGIFDIQYSYNKASDYKKYEYTASTDGLKASQSYGDADIAKVEVLEDMKLKSTETTIDGVKYAGYVQGTTNPSPKAGNIPTAGAAVKITAVADSTITFVVNKTNKVYHFVESETKADQNSQKDTDGKATGTLTEDTYKFNMEGGKTYYFYLDGSKVGIFKFILEKGTPDLDWTTVENPVLDQPVIDNEKGTISVNYSAVIGDDGGESLKLIMYKDGEQVDEKITKATGKSGTVEFTPAATGNYTFKAILSRSGETDKESETVKADGFILPLKKPSGVTATNKGNGSILVEWNDVAEADEYQVSYSQDGTTFSKEVSVTSTEYLYNGLTVGKAYIFKVVAIRKNPSTVSEPGSVIANVKQEEERKWNYVTYGNGADASKDKVTGSAIDGSVTIKSSSGKIVPDSFDGLTFYYTEIPSTMNFTIKAKVKVNSWLLSNGQEGFGLMAADRLGVAGSDNINSSWNNQYMAIATKVEYIWDSEQNIVTTDDSFDKTTHKLGIGALAKTGLTKDNVKDIEKNNTSVIQRDFSSTTTPLELRYPDYKNVIGNGLTTKNKEIKGTCTSPITEMYMTIQKNNTGYFITYESVDGSYSTTKKYYDPKALEQLDSDKVYAGFFAARNADVTFTDIQVTTIDPANDLPAEERPIEQVAVNTKIQTPSATSQADYEFIFSANCDGKLSIVDESGNTIVSDYEVKNKTNVKPAKVTLNKGKNNFKLYFTPNADYTPGYYMEMASYDTKEIDFTITYKTIGEENQSLWVAPGANGSGTKDDPMDIYEAVKYVQPSQQIVLKEGTYKLESSLKISRGNNGTKDKLIYMIADPDAATRPVIDFQELCTGMVIGGDYWYFKGFDVTNSANAQKGIQVSGNHNTLDQIEAYHNGNTGIQISRLYSSDTTEYWPSYNLVLNCTSYGNADAGCEDADGFAAKLTVGDGNVFDGCIAHHNADDGWDLYAKVQTGSIGVVTIKNCIAYANGYLEDGSDAGNGNGFKMGGDSMPGGHILENSIAFANKAKGIDSNSCPDIKVKNSTSINNGMGSDTSNKYPNVAFYTNTAANTDYEADGVISFKTIENLYNISDNIKEVGTQDISKIYKETNYYWNGTDKAVNSKGDAVKADWFKSLDYSNIIDGVVSVGNIARNTDGTIALGDLFALTDKVPAGVGADFSHDKLTASNGVTVGESVKTGDFATHMIPVYVGIMLVAMLGAAFVLLEEKKRKRA